MLEKDIVTMTVFYTQVLALVIVFAHLACKVYTEHKAKKRVDNVS